MQASKDAKVCSSVLQAERNGNAVWDTLLDRAKDIAALYNTKPSVPRRAESQQHRENVEADTPSAYWKRADNIPFLGHLVSEVNQLLVKPLPSFHRAMSNARLSSLSVIRVHKHKEINFNEVISKFAGKKDRRLALSL